MRNNRQPANRSIADPRRMMPWSEAQSKDRLSSTLFLAGLLHGVILLGVTFTALDSPPDASSMSFDVVLITDTNDLEAPADEPRIQESLELVLSTCLAGDGGVNPPNSTRASDVCVSAMALDFHSMRWPWPKLPRTTPRSKQSAPTH